MAAIGAATMIEQRWHVLQAHTRGRPFYSKPIGIDPDARDWFIHCGCGWVGTGDDKPDVLVQWSDHVDHALDLITTAEKGLGKHD